MKKIIKTVTILTIMFFLTACGKNTTNEETKENEKEHATIILKEDGKEFDKKEVTFTKNVSLQTIMETNFEVDMAKDFISGIDGHKQDAAASKYWLYDVNGEQPDVGAVEYFLKDGDVVTWSLDKL